MSDQSTVSHLSVSDVVKRLVVSQHTVRRYTKLSKLPAERVYGEHGMEYRVRPTGVWNPEG